MARIGSCLGAMARLLAQQPEAFDDFDLPATNEGSPLANAGYVFELLQSYLVTHAHWGEPYFARVHAEVSDSPPTPQITYRYAQGTQNGPS